LVGIYASQLARQRCIDPLCSHDIGCTAGIIIDSLLMSAALFYAIIMPVSLNWRVCRYIQSHGNLVVLSFTLL
jgi:hypothetical protein